MKTLQKIALGIGAGILAVAGGCAGNNANYHPRVNQNQAKHETYESPAVKKEWGFKVFNKWGNVDGTKPVFIQEDKLHVIGYSRAYSTEGMAVNAAQSDAYNRVLRATSKPQRVPGGLVYAGRVDGLFCGNREINQVKVINKMKKTNLFKTGATLAALVLAGCSAGNVQNNVSRTETANLARNHPAVECSYSLSKCEKPGYVNIS